TQRAPRWRMMMPPARMAWPSLTLMPSRLEWESRPFLDEPPPFLCAIGRRIIGTEPLQVKRYKGWRNQPGYFFRWGGHQWDGKRNRYPGTVGHGAELRGQFFLVRARRAAGR